MECKITHQWFFSHSPETVWEFLTDPGLLSAWLMENNFKPLVGHQFQFKAKARVNIGFDGNIYCEVLEVNPYKRLSYSWRGGPGNGKMTLDSVVTWTLTEKDGGTELLLTHTGFKGIRNYIPYLVMNKGWMVILKKRLSQKINNYKNEAATS
jgi:uncharacterized protein YndB with AHSA1/START domain